MPPSFSIDLATVRSSGTAFWSRGNRPTQLLRQLDHGTVSLHLKSLYLLTERVVGAASFFFESPITRSVTNELAPLFTTGEVLYFVDETIEDFAEHGSRKAEKSPDTLTCYADYEFVQRCGAELDGLDHILRRPPASLSDRIVELWVMDLYSLAPGTLGQRLEVLEPDPDRRASVTTQMSRLGYTRGSRDFVWEYLQPELTRLGLPDLFCRLARYRLAQMYSIATSAALGVALDTSDTKLGYSEVDEHSRYDSGIFISCMDALGATDALRCIFPADLIRLKVSPEFRVFREFYFTLLHTVAGDTATMKTWLPLYRRIAVEFSTSGRTVEEFLLGFQELCRSMRKPFRTYRRPLDALLRLCDLSDQLTVEAFLAALDRVCGGVQHYNPSVSTNHTRRVGPLDGPTGPATNYIMKAYFMGDNFSDLSNVTIISRSVVERSFNKFNEKDPDTAAALLAIAEHIAGANSKEAGEAFAAFNEELQRETPRKPVLASLWSGVVAALPAITQLTTAVEKIKALLS